MSKETYTNIIAALKNAGASMRCREVKTLLMELDFNVRDGKRGGHKVYTHPFITSFTSGAFNCDHGKNPEIKRPYINKIIKTLEKYESEIIEYLENRKAR